MVTNSLSLKEKSISNILLVTSKFVTSRSLIGIRRIVSLLELIALPKDKNFYRRIKSTLNEDNPQFQLYKRILVESNENFRDKIIRNLLIKGAVLDQKKREQEKRNGLEVPASVLISPTMRCNLSCKGCYASSYSKKDDLEFEVIDRIISEAKEMGVAFFTILGGEPFIRDDIFSIFEKHNDVFFHVYTNGTLLNEETVKKIVSLGNVMPEISIEGFEYDTDNRRGKHVYEKVLNAMKLLKENKLPFGYSVTVTRNNIETITSDKFIDMMIDNGAIIGWYFLYMPIGKNPDLSLMPTPEQRLYLKERRSYIRENKPLFIIDFWNDAPYVGGCIAAKRYLHINHRGDVEPCIFTHIAQVNIKNTTLREAIKCEFFEEIRKRQPFSDNYYLPCMLIDHPEVSRWLYENLNVYPTHPGAECMFTDIKNELDDYSKKVESLYQDVWEKEKQNFNIQINQNKKEKDKNIKEKETISAVS
jgi:MoaA/NifB/PqqE/SkfB family radical SAM enzyme